MLNALGESHLFCCFSWSENIYTEADSLRNKISAWARQYPAKLGAGGLVCLILMFVLQSLFLFSPVYCWQLGGQTHHGSRVTFMCSVRGRVLLSQGEIYSLV